MKSERENLLMVLRGEQPEYVPDWERSITSIAAEVCKDPFMAFYGREEGQQEHVDCFGVEWVFDVDGPVCKPGFVMFDDIAEWREHFHIPDLKGYDWDAAVARDSVFLDPERATELSFVNMYFGALTNSMGFEEGLCAFVEDPDEVAAFFDALSDFYLEVALQYLRRMDVDLVQLCDDFASSRAMFVSPEVYRSLLKPYYRKVIDGIRAEFPDVFIEFHCCGAIDEVIDDFVEIGVNMWQPAQPMNDLARIKRTYGNRLVLCGVWDGQGERGIQLPTEELVRQSVRDAFDEFAPGGGFVFWSGGAVGSTPDMVEKFRWIDEESEAYRKAFYQTDI